MDEVAIGGMGSERGFGSHMYVLWGFFLFVCLSSDLPLVHREFIFSRCTAMGGTSRMARKIKNVPNDLEEKVHIVCLF